MTATVARPRVLGRFAGALDVATGLLAHDGFVRASDVRVACKISTAITWQRRLAEAGIVPIERSGIARSKWITVAEAKRLLEAGR